MKVYVVAKGEYSDYSVVAAFKRKAKAQRFASKLDDGDVLELEVLTRNPHKVVRHCAGVERTWDRDTGSWGSWSEIKAWSYDVWDFEAAEHTPRMLERANFVRATGCDSAEQAAQLIAGRLAQTELPCSDRSS